MKKIVIIGANEFQNPLIMKVKELGYEAHVFAWEEGAIGEKTADYFYPISIVEKELILRECEKIRPDAVVSIGSDLANITVQYLMKKLGMTTNSSRCIEMTTNKYKMRCALNKAGVSSPRYMVIDNEMSLEGLADFQYPVIIKPTDRSGSRGIYKVEQPDKVQGAVCNSIDYSFEKKVIMEEYIDGEEFSCESISFEGTHHFLAITKKFTTGAPHFIETGHLEPVELEKCIIQEIYAEISRALDVLEIRYGAAHTEFKISETGNIKIIEIGSRMGGDCIGSHLVEISTGFDYVEMVIEVALGNKPGTIPKHPPKWGLIWFIFSQEDYSKLQYLQGEYRDEIYMVSEIELDEISNKVVDSGSRHGFYIITSDDLGKINSIMKVLNGSGI